MNYWIFQANLEHDLRKYLREGKDDTWLVSRYWQQMSEGDLIFFWLGGSPKIRGIYGWGTIAAAPKLDSDQGYSVKVRYHKLLKNHLAAQQLQKSSGLDYLLILRQAQGTNFILSREQARAIADLMLPEERPHVPPVPQELIDSIHTGDCVLFAGAGLSARAGVPTWDQFLSSLLNLARENQIVDPAGADSFAAAMAEGERNAVADGLLHAFGAEREKLQQFLLTTFPAQQGLSAAHELISRIPFAAVVTTNYDALLEKAFPQYAEAGFYTPADAEALLDALSQKRRFVLKLYGDLEKPETLILAPIEYQETVSSNVSFAKFVEGLFFSRTFFFAGLSLEGIQDFLSGFVFRGAVPRRHYALVAVSGTAWKARADLLERRFNVRVIDYPVSETYPEFETFLETLSRSTSPSLSVQEKSAGIAGPNPGIRRIILEDIGSFDRLELDFAKDQWKVLLGDNGVGKSTVLKAIAAAIIGSDARSYAGRLVRAGKTRGRITITTERNPHGYITDILTKDMLSDSEVISMPSRYMEAEGGLALGFSPLRSVTWSASSGPQPIIQKGRPTADDLIPLLAGDADPRMDRLKQWIVNVAAADPTSQPTSQSRHEKAASSVSSPGASAQSQTIKRLFQVIAVLTDRKDIEYLRVTENFRVMVKVAEAPAGVPLELLSQGLTSLLGWVGYLCQRLRETAQDSSSDSLPTSGYALVLIDEIDAHMHPRWQQVMVQRLKQIFPNIQFIASTHSPFIAGGLEASEVVRFERDSSGFVRITTPEHSLKGIGAAGLLTSDMFGLASHLDSETAEALDRKRQLTAKRLDPALPPPEKTAIETELHQLEDLVKSVDTTKFIRDPLYLQFVEAMSRVQPASPEESIVLTPKEREQKAELAEKILRDLMKKEKKPAKK